MPAALWIIVAAAAASISLALGMRQTFGLFLLPLAAEQGSRPASSAPQSPSRTWSGAWRSRSPARWATAMAPAASWPGAPC
ncbi:hypothetical protein ACFQY5_28425 [Paeniroseomonas aquatica]|uniref:hypothetical protein n=1 Tax=Paeniroseomonas aquatica TaxID=373043 RepID=UPI003623BEB9